MGLLYVLTNIKNNKKYVGQTMYSFDYRLNQHLKCMQAGSELAIHRAMRKYGINSFIYETRNVPDELLDYYEIFVIEKLNTFGVQGYNMTRGGAGCRIINQSVRDKITELWRLGWSSADIAFEADVSVVTVRNILVSAGIDKEAQKDRSLLSVSRHLPRRQVVEIAISDSRILKIYDSVTAAAGGKLSSVSQISECCLRNRASAGGSFWRYMDEVPSEDIATGIYSGNLPKRFGLDWNKTYNYDAVRELWETGMTGTEITRTLGCKNVAYILDKLGISNSERVIRARKAKSKIVVAFSLDGFMVAEYGSVTEAALYAGVCASSIIRAAQYCRSAVNLQWRYKSSLNKEELSSGFIGPYFDRKQDLAKDSGRPVVLVSCEDGSVQEFYGIREAGRKIGVSCSTIIRYINNNLKINNSHLYYKDEMEK